MFGFFRRKGTSKNEKRKNRSTPAFTAAGPTGGKKPAFLTWRKSAFSDKGFSLVEVLAATALMGLVITTVSTVLVSMFQHYHEQSMRYRDINDTRQALITIAEELRDADGVEIEEGEIMLNGGASVISASEEEGEMRVVRKEGESESVIMFDAETFDPEIMEEIETSEEGSIVKVILGRERVMETVIFVEGAGNDA